jgi:hypothetical protein
MSKTIDVKEFAKRVERLCEFLLDRVERDGNKDVVEIQKIKEDAADLQAGDNEFTFEGLSDHMRGAP